MTWFLFIACLKALAVMGIVYGLLNLWELVRTGRCEMQDWL